MFHIRQLLKPVSLPSCWNDYFATKIVIWVLKFHFFRRTTKICERTFFVINSADNFRGWNRAEEIKWWIASGFLNCILITLSYRRWKVEHSRIFVSVYVCITRCVLLMLCWYMIVNLLIETCYILNYLGEADIKKMKRNILPQRSLVTLSI